MKVPVWAKAAVLPTVAVKTTSQLFNRIREPNVSKMNLCIGVAMSFRKELYDLRNLGSTRTRFQ